jgi:hypothetical protein
MKHWLTFSGVHGVISEKTVVSIMTTVRTSDPTIVRNVSSTLVVTFVMKNCWEVTAIYFDVKQES